MVRTKVDGMRLKQGNMDRTEQHALRRQIRRYMDLAYQYALAFSRPRIWVVFGMIASGKSTLARSLSESLGIAVLNSDEVRKELFRGRGLKSGRVPAYAGMYSQEATALTYGRLLLKAQEVLDQGRSIILDATFSRSRHRDEVRRLATDMDAGIRLIACTCPEEQTIERLRRRENQACVSDARLEHLEAIKSRYQSPDEIPDDQLIRIDTRVPTAENVIRILSSL
jgi:predicted kinase